MTKNSEQTRRLYGCGYLPRDPQQRLGLWTPPPLVDEWNRTDPSERAADPVMYCAGYTTMLPEVQEAASLYPHWGKGTLEAVLDGDEPTKETAQALAILANAANARDSHRMEMQAEEARRRHGSQ